MRVTFVGQGYVEDVGWELPPSDGPEGAAQDESDVLRMGETCAQTASRHQLPIFRSALHAPGGTPFSFMLPA